MASFLKQHTSLELAKAKVLFGDHLELSARKNTTVRLLSSKTIPTPLKDVYVPTTFSCKDDEEGEVIDHVLISDIRDKKRVVLKGNGGSGKTFFLKYLWLTIFEEPYGKLPIFLELRKFNDFHTPDIKQLIRFTISPNDILEEEVFENLLSAGAFVFILDGFDECSRSIRKTVEKQILDLEHKAPNCGMVVSSRANEIFFGWTNFYVYDVNGFDINQVKLLVKKATVGNDTKKGFLKTLNEDFYNQHRTFLSNPLLALMMLITFRDNASIPENLTTFYELVFNTLFFNHDAMKEAFSRERSLSMIEFKKLFAAFCILTYVADKYEFDEDELLTTLEKAKKILNDNTIFDVQIVPNVNEIKADIIESVNLIHKDGSKYVFTHRSFQEYFAAYFATQMDPQKLEEFMQIFSSRVFDNALKISYQMNPSSVINKFFLPTFINLQKKEYLFLSQGLEDDLKLMSEIQFRLLAEVDLKSGKLVPLYTPQHISDCEIGQFTIGCYQTIFDREIETNLLRIHNEVHEKFSALCKANQTSILKLVDSETEIVRFSFEGAKLIFGGYHADPKSSDPGTTYSIRIIELNDPHLLEQLNKVTAEIATFIRRSLNEMAQVCEKLIEMQEKINSKSVEQMYGI